MQLQVGNTVGAIFALKNMGWMDKTQTDLSHSVTDFDIKDVLKFTKTKD